MIDRSLYPRYRELYQYIPVFARKKVIEVYRITRKKSLTASIVKTKRRNENHQFHFYRFSHVIR